MRILAGFLAVALLAGVAGAAPKKRPIVTDTYIEILSPIRFVGASPALAASSSKILDAVAATLRGNPSIRVMAVVGFGNDTALDPTTLGLLRARTIVAELVRRGVEPQRLRAEGRAKPAHGSDPAPELIIVDRAPTS